MGATVFRWSPTHRDPIRSFALVRGSPIDSGRLSRTSGNCMACRRSGVRIPLAPPFFACLFDEKVPNYWHWIMASSRPQRTPVITTGTSRTSGTDATGDLPAREAPTVG